MNKPSGHIQANERVTFSIRYQDDDLLVVEKPARVVTQPGVGHQHDTLLNGLFAKFGPQLQGWSIDSTARPRACSSWH